MNVKVLGHGTEKHQLVEIDVLQVPKKIRKMYGIAKDKSEENFFKLLGFKLVNNKCKSFRMYERFFNTAFQKDTNEVSKREM